jgi:hypothetical protein
VFAFGVRIGRVSVFPLGAGSEEPNLPLAVASASRVYPPMGRADN